MAIDFKGIPVKYLGIDAGVASIDTTITRNNFYKNKPNGIFTCFTFAGKGFGGNDYKSLQSIVSAEATQMWDRTNRNTFLGFNEETKQLIVNLNGWLSAKDSDLQTVGELPHPEQAGWFETEIQTTKDADSKFEFLQKDGSKAWLKIKPFEIKTGRYNRDAVYPATAVESKEKSVLGSTLFRKNGALFAKSIEDNSVMMVNDCVLDYPVISPTSTLLRDNKEYGTALQASSSYQYGKRIFSFETTTSINPITFASNNVYIKNQSASKEFELTRTNNLEDILASGESLTFMIDLKFKGIQFVNSYFKDKSSEVDKPFDHAYYYAGGKSYFYYDSSIYKNKQASFFSNLDKSVKGIPFEMTSCDTRKPFTYSPSDEYEFIVSGFYDQKQFINTYKILNMIPSGFIFVLSTGGGPIILKDGKAFQKSATAPNATAQITGTTQFGNELYYSKDGSGKLTSDSISKDDLISATGFREINITEDSSSSSSLNYSTFLITVYRI